MYCTVPPGLVTEESASCLATRVQGKVQPTVQQWTDKYGFSSVHIFVSAVARVRNGSAEWRVEKAPNNSKLMKQTEPVSDLDLTIYTKQSTSTTVMIDLYQPLYSRPLAQLSLSFSPIQVGIKIMLWVAMSKLTNSFAINKKHLFMSRFEIFWL